MEAIVFTIKIILWMIILFGVIFILGGIAFLAQSARALFTRRTFKVPYYHMNPKEGNVYDQVRGLLKFMQERARITDVDFSDCKSGKWAKSMELYDFMLRNPDREKRMEQLAYWLCFCHSLGCEVVVRQFGTGESEEREISSDSVREYFQYVTEIKRKDEYYRSQYCEQGMNEA